MSCKVALIGFTLLVMLLTGCQKADKMPTISQLTYVSESGTLLPELQWHEEFIIRSDSITFTRSGISDKSNVNTGSWQVPFEAATLSTLFETLINVDLSKIDRIEPIDPPDGGGSDSYVLTYSNGKTWSLEFTNGATYINGEWISQPVQDFINGLQLPSEAASRYKL